MLTVEFFGLPGSGKSTFTNHLIESLNGCSLEDAVRRRIMRHGHDRVIRLAARTGGAVWRAAYARDPDRFAALTRYTSDHPEMIEVAGAAMAAKRARGIHRDSTASFLLNFLARYQLALEGDPRKIVVIDEGFAQKAIMLFAHGFQEMDHFLLERYLALAPIPTVLVHVETGADVCAKRIAARGWREGVLGNPSRRHAFLEGAAAVCRCITQSGFAGTKTVTISGSGNLLRERVRLVEDVMRCLGDLET